MNIFQSMKSLGRVKVDVLAQATGCTVMDSVIRELPYPVTSDETGKIETHVVIARIKGPGIHRIIWFCSDSYGNCFELEEIYDIAIPMSKRLSEVKSKMYFNESVDKVMEALNTTTEKMLAQYKA